LLLDIGSPGLQYYCYVSVAGTGARQWGREMKVPGMVFQRFVSRIAVLNGRLLALKPAQFRTDTPVV
jgi:hypothetical protein